MKKYILRYNSLQAKYYDGLSVTQEIMQTLTNQSHLLQKSYFSEFSNERYYDVIFKQLPNFIERYDYLYDGLNFLYDFDYPLIDGISMHQNFYDLEGLEFVMEYISRFILEQSVINYFDKSEIITLLTNYEKKYKVDIETLGCNLIEIILKQSLYVKSTKGMGLFVLRNETIDLKMGWSSLLASFNKPLQDYLITHKEYILGKLLIMETHNTLEQIYVPNKIHHKNIIKYPYQLTNQEYTLQLRQLQKIESMKKLHLTLANLALHPEDFMSLLNDLNLDDKDIEFIFINQSPLSLVTLLHYYNPTLHAFNQSKDVQTKAFWEDYKEIPNYKYLRKAVMIHIDYINSFLNT